MVFEVVKTDFIDFSSASNLNSELVSKIVCFVGLFRPTNSYKEGMFIED